MSLVRVDSRSDDGRAGYDRLRYPVALLAVFLSSVIQTLLFVLAYVLGIGFGVFIGWILGIFIGALLLRLCLSPFGWTISLKAAALIRLVCGFLSGVVVGFVFAILFATSQGPSDHRVVTLGPAVFLAASILELLTSALVITFFATPLEELHIRPAWTPPASAGPHDSSYAGGPPVYSVEDFMADSARARSSYPST